jgi:serine/threonine protein kinase
VAILFSGRGDSHPADYYVVPDVVESTSGNRYEITDRIAAGGNGVVHRCSDLATGIDYAAKFQLDLRPARRQRFLREQKLIANLSHDHLIKYVDHGQTRGTHVFRGKNRTISEMPFIVMEVARASLADVVREGDVPKEIYYAQFRGLARALGELHRLAFHRDIKPENILVVGDRWVLSDYGLCAPFDSSVEEQLTPDWAVVGPRYWMSPEANNRSVGRNDAICAASDVFQLASVFWYVVNRSHPTGVLERRDWTGPDALFKPVHLALHHNAAMRPQSGVDFAVEIEAAILS